ncbi:MAG: HesA/MoeB/ThiF family protein [Muribaculaceae bacterium]|nr:HesA/MoeB/ThiF family protein [Muribaculaceae bacterium]
MVDLRYSRQIMLEEIGEEGQKRLASSSVLIVGLGGLGSIVASYLNGAGIGRIGLVDNDKVSLSNLHRQILYTEAQVGLSKATCAAEFLSDRCRATRLTAYDESLQPANADKLVAEYDVVVDCTDNFFIRFLIDDTCRKLGKFWVYGAIGEFEGQVAIFDGRSDKRFTDLYPERDFLCSLPKATSGVVGPLPGVVGAIQSLETIKLIAGVEGALIGKLFTINLLTFETNLINF